MRKATSPLCRCNWTTVTRDMVADIRRITRERVWELLERLVRVEWQRLFPGRQSPGGDASNGSATAAPEGARPEDA